MVKRAKSAEKLGSRNSKMHQFQQNLNHGKLLIPSKESARTTSDSMSRITPAMTWYSKEHSSVRGMDCCTVLAINLRRPQRAIVIQSRGESRNGWGDRRASPSLACQLAPNQP